MLTSNKSRAIVLTILSVLVVAFCALSGRLFIRTLALDLPVISPCYDRRGRGYEAPPAGDADLYYACVNERAHLFLSVDYAEAKDASKAFLTLLTAILVASITFSEKIVDVAKSTWTSRIIMIVSWVLLLLAIGSCGAALALMMMSAGYATYFPQVNYRLLEGDAVNLYKLSGLAFGSALAALLVAGVTSMVARSGSANKPSDPPLP
jgi:hypothetical protein